MQEELQSSNSHSLTHILERQPASEECDLQATYIRKRTTYGSPHTNKVPQLESQLQQMIVFLLYIQIFAVKQISRCHFLQIWLTFKRFSLTSMKNVAGKKDIKKISSQIISFDSGVRGQERKYLNLKNNGFKCMIKTAINYPQNYRRAGRLFRH